MKQPEDSKDLSLVSKCFNMVVFTMLWALTDCCLGICVLFPRQEPSICDSDRQNHDPGVRRCDASAWIWMNIHEWTWELLNKKLTCVCGERVREFSEKYESHKCFTWILGSISPSFYDPHSLITNGIANGGSGCHLPPTNTCFYVKPNFILHSVFMIRWKLRCF